MQFQTFNQGLRQGLKVWDVVRISLILHIFGVNVLEQKFLAYFHVNFKSQSSQSARNHPLSEEAVKYPVDKRPMISVSFLINEPLLKLISLEVIHLFCHLSFIHFLCCCSLLLNLDFGCLRVKGKHPTIFKNPPRSSPTSSNGKLPFPLERRIFLLC